MADVNIRIRLQKDRAQAELDRLQRSTRSTRQSFERLNISVRNSTSAFKVFAGNVAAIAFDRVARSAASFIGSTIQVTAELEKTATQFEVLTGSAQQADQAIRDLQQFAANTPFQFQDLARAEQRLLSFGFSLEQSQKLLTDLGDVSAASGADLSELALIFGQVSAAGKLTGERLLQLQERAIPIGPALAETLGVTEESIRDLVSQGQVSFADFERAFTSLNETGEFAFGGLEKRSQTLQGRISTLSDNFNLLQASVGERLAPALKAATTVLTQFIQRLQNSGAITNFVDALASRIPSAIQFAFSAFQFLVDGFFAIRGAINNVSVFIDAFIDGILNLAQATLKGIAAVKEFFGQDTSGLETQIETIRLTREEIENSAVATIEANNSLAASQKSLSDQVAQASEFVQKAYQDELAAAQEQADGTIEAQTRKKDTVVQLTQEELEARKAAAEEQKKILEQIELAEQDVAVAREARRLFESEQEQIFTDERLLALEDAFTREQEARIQAGINAAENEQQKQLLILQAQAQGEQAQLASLKKKQEAEAKLREQNRRIALQGTANLFGSLADATALGGQKLFKITQAFTLAETVVNSVLAVQRAAASAPFPFNIPAIAAETVRGAVNVAKIKSTAPRFQSGGVVPGSSVNGDQVLARVNSGEMILNDRQQSRLFELIDRGANMSQQPITTVVEIDGAEVARSVSTQVANGLELGEVF